MINKITNNNNDSLANQNVIELFINSFYDLVTSCNTANDNPPAPPSATASGTSNTTIIQPLLWDQNITPLVFPLHIDIIMGDVHGGSNSPSMAKKVLQWRKEYPIEAKELYSQLSNANGKICNGMKKLNNYMLNKEESGSSNSNNELINPNYCKAISWCNETQQDQWEVKFKSQEVSDIF